MLACDFRESTGPSTSLRGRLRAPLLQQQARILTKGRPVASGRTTPRREGHTRLVVSPNAHQCAQLHAARNRIGWTQLQHALHHRHDGIAHTKLGPDAFKSQQRQRHLVAVGIAGNQCTLQHVTIGEGRGLHVAFVFRVQRHPQRIGAVWAGGGEAHDTSRARPCPPSPLPWQRRTGPTARAA